MADESAAYSILQLPAEERPRERLQRHGPEVMSTAELLAIILGSGSKGQPVLQLAHAIVAQFGSLKSLAEASVAELCQIKGLGSVKALQLRAALCLGVRLSRQSLPAKYQVENPIHAYNLVKDELAYEQREIFMVLLLDVRGGVITQEVVTIGTLSETLIHPREVFYPAIRHKAASIILIHNHPSGDPSPSPEDYEVTKQLLKAGMLISIPIHDHLIVGGNSFVSMRQEGFAF
jgi:DNA repair protein RadC